MTVRTSASVTPPRRPPLTRVVAFAGGLYRRRAMLACAGYLGRDPMAQLQLRPGRVDPYAVYDRLRASGPLTPTRLGDWVSTSHSVCESVLRDRRFAVRPEDAEPGQTGMSFLSMNPPDHTRLRRLAMPAFSPKAVAGYTGRIESTAVELLDAARADGRFDLVSGFAECAADEHPVAGEVRRAGVRDAEQVGDDDDGQRRGEPGDQVEPAGLARRVQQFPGGALDPGRIARHRLRAERGHREPAQPGVVRRVHGEEGHAGLTRFGARGPDGEAPVAQHRLAHAVAGAHPVAEAGRGERAPRPEPVVDRVGVHPARAQLELRHRIAPQVPGAGEQGPLPVEPAREHDHPGQPGSAGCHDLSRSPNSHVYYSKVAAGQGDPVSGGGTRAGA